MKKIITSVVALLVMGSVAFAQDAAPTTTKKKMTKKTETKMDSKGNKSATTTTDTKETKMDSKGGKMKSHKKTTATTETKMK